MKARQEWSITQPHPADPIQPDYLTPDVLVASVPYQRTKAGHLIPPAILAVEVVSPQQQSLFTKAQMYAARVSRTSGSSTLKHGIASNSMEEIRFTKVNHELRVGALSVLIDDVFT